MDSFLKYRVIGLQICFLNLSRTVGCKKSKNEHAVLAQHITMHSVKDGLNNG